MTYVTEALRHNPELAIFLTLAVGFVFGRLRIGTLPPRQRRRDAARGRPDRAARHRGRPDRQDRLLRSLPLRHGLQGRPAVHPRARPERPAAGRADGRPLRHEPRGHGGGREGLPVRLRDGGGPDGGRLHGVDGHRHGGRYDQSPRPPGRREGPTPEQHPRGLRGVVPRRDGLRRLVPLEPRAAPPEGGPEGREPEAGDRSSRARRRRGPTKDSAYREWDLRAYRLDDAAWAGRSVADLEKSFAPERVFVERIRRGAEILDAFTGDRSSAAATPSRSPPVAGCSPAESPSASRSRTGRCSTFRWSRSTSWSRTGASWTAASSSSRSCYGRGVALLQARSRRRGDPVGSLRRRSIAATSCGSSGATPDVERTGAALGYIERPSQRDRRRLRRSRHRRGRARRLPLGQRGRPAALA